MRVAWIILIALLTPAIGLAMPFPKTATTAPLVMVGAPAPAPAPSFVPKTATTQPLTMVGVPVPPPAPPFTPRVATTQPLTMIGVPEGEKGPVMTTAMDRSSTAPAGVIASKGQPPNLMLYPVGFCGKSDPVTGVPLGTGCYRGTATVVFRTEDLPIGFDPNSIQYAHCYFGLRKTDGTLHHPGAGTPYFDQLPSADSLELMQPENLFPAGLSNWRPGEGRYPYRWQTRVYFPR